MGGVVGGGDVGRCWRGGGGASVVVGVGVGGSTRSMGVVVDGGDGSRRRGGGSWRSAEYVCASSSSKAPVKALAGSSSQVLL